MPHTIATTTTTPATVISTISHMGKLSGEDEDDEEAVLFVDTAVVVNLVVVSSVMLPFRPGDDGESAALVVVGCTVAALAKAKTMTNNKVMITLLDGILEKPKITTIYSKHYNVQPPRKYVCRLLLRHQARRLR